ncbi:hypothetical protein [Pseudoxanthomonas winnipegensis]|jgi:hypothetical protein|uniref:Uncharacterized protein n=1 Tax=Pseudoxanthomonas winnipegensis TaxID=2480810 RepID=A0A4Q8L686_9GAMM|nr:hypothetical protein [Pseudoxanthomonas winnipegensis]TAA23261.1 hypothetical protein EA660_15075 [Pseudoxanthomonas winnipegensis]
MAPLASTRRAMLRKTSRAPCDKGIARGDAAAAHEEKVTKIGRMCAAGSASRGCAQRLSDVLRHCQKS